jgi:hypothetical protein
MEQNVFQKLHAQLTQLKQLAMLVVLMVMEFVYLRQEPHPQQLELAVK